MEWFNPNTLEPIDGQMCLIELGTENFTGLGLARYDCKRNSYSVSNGAYADNEYYPASKNCGNRNNVQAWADIDRWDGEYYHEQH